MNAASESPVVVINVFTLKPGMLDAFVEAQTGGLRRMAGHIPGLRNGRVYRAAEGDRAILVSTFESAAHLSQWKASEDLARHRERVSPYVERSDQAQFELVYESVAAA